MDAARGRLLYIDNIRLMVIVLVVVVHISVTYSGLGSWFYLEGGAMGPAQLTGFNFFQSMIQSFVMGLLFLIAGYFVPGAYDRKGPRKFLHDRVVRLGVPALLYLFFINPLVVYFEVGGYAGMYPSFGQYYAVSYIGNLGFFKRARSHLVCGRAAVFLRRLRGRSQKGTGQKEETSSHKKEYLASDLHYCGFHICDSAGERPMG